MGSSESEGNRKPYWLIILLACIPLLIAVIEFGPIWFGETKEVITVPPEQSVSPDFLNIDGVAISEDERHPTFIGKSRIGIQGVPGESLTDKNGSFKMEIPVSTLRNKSSQVKFWLIPPGNPTKVFSDKIYIAEEYITSRNYNITITFPIPVTETQVLDVKTPKPTSQLRYLLSGEILDPEFQPIAGARVSFNGKETYSDATGKFYLKISENTQQKILISKNGFEDYSDYKFPKENIQIKLNPRK